MQTETRQHVNLLVHKKKKKKFKSSTEPRPEPRSQHREGDEKETELPGFCYGNTTGTNHTQNCKTNI